MSTFMAKKETLDRRWYIIDAAGKPLGKTAVAVRSDCNFFLVAHIFCTNPLYYFTKYHSSFYSKCQSTTHDYIKKVIFFYDRIFI